MNKLISTLMLLSLVACNSGGGGGSSSSTQSENYADTKKDEVGSDSDKPANSVETDRLLIVPKRKVELEADFSNFTEFRDNINRYEVVFEVKSGDFSNATLECRKMIYDRTDSTVFGRFKDNSSEATVDLTVLENDPNEVNYKCSATDNGVLLDAVEFKIPKSYVIRGQKTLQAAINATEISTLVLDKGAELSTNGEDINLKVDELISNDGKVVTYHAENITKTFENRPGASGGVIDLTVNKGIGAITFELRGMNGGAQTRVPEKNPALTPFNPAKNGTCHPSGEYRKTDTRCMGKPGDKGAIGLQGFKGMPGGNSGILNLKTISEQNLNISIVHFPGKGAIGGNGGKGGVGGPGGKGNYIRYYVPSPHDNCRSMTCSQKLLQSIQGIWVTHQFQDGPIGPEGDVGPIGPTGDDGVINESTVTFQDEKMSFIVDKNWKNF
ncbi:hypothetical protein ACJVC5_17610 [Peredibacter sp. HCB2-198]|uniref:hypothetical protein n=1 Tax=Peredibacter sp. HCB2-198 TaxID=3383025 RepID=UPI0038B5F3B5